MKSYWKNILFTIFHPSFWIMIKPYSYEWDKKLKELMEKGEKFVLIDKFTAKIGGIELWIANYPFSAFVPNRFLIDVRPSRFTIYKAYKKLIHDSLTNKEKEGEK